MHKKKIWSHAALLFAVMYAVYVSLNYVVQLATVIPFSLQGALDSSKASAKNKKKKEMRT
jgi:hypothetical protein